MNGEMLLEHFDRIAEAPDAVARLRQFVLDLAVRGKLVESDINAPQHANEPRVQSRSSSRTKRRPLPPVSADDQPFPVPESWQWVRIREVASDHGQTVPTDAFTYIDVTAIDKEAGRIAAPKVLAANEAPSRARRIVKRGDVIYSCVRPTLLNVAVVDRDFDPTPIASTAFAVLAGGERVLSEYMWIVLRSPYMVACVEERVRGQAYPAINDADFALLPFPLPSVPEQHRIVAKVNELMKLCDQLEAAQNEREQTRDRLVAASLQRVTGSAGHADEEVAAAPESDDAIEGRAEHFRQWAEFVFKNFPRLATKPEHVKQLQQAILGLAIRGRLVPQNADDEPATTLLRYVRERRHDLHLAGAIPKPKPLPSWDELSRPFSLPQGWSWSMLGELCYQVSDGPHFSPKYVSPELGVPFLSTRNIRLDGIDISTAKYVSRQDHEEFCKRIRPQKGDILYTKGGTTGIAKVNDLDIEFSVWVHVAVLRIEKDKLCPRYIELALNSPHCYMQAQQFTQGTSNFDLGLTRMIKITLPLPPLEEQHRIVAKVDELMGLCESLAEQVTANSAKCARLLEAALRGALVTARELEVAA